VGLAGFQKKSYMFIFVILFSILRLQSEAKPLLFVLIFRVEQACSNWFIFKHTFSTR
jgi:hypothetical protein